MIIHLMAVQKKITPGIAKRLIARGIKFYEVVFWDPTPTKPLARTSRAKSCPGFIDVRDQYTLVLHQGIIEREILDEISARVPNSQVLRPCEYISCRNLSNPLNDDDHCTHKNRLEYPIEAIIKLEDGTEKLIRTKYLLGCDGAKSTVRKSLNDRIKLEGAGPHAVWGVMDCWVESDFPDMRLKCLIHSRHEGSIMTIPRENNLVRFYVQLQGKASHGARMRATLQTCQEKAKKIFYPYSLKFGDTDWFSVYQAGQRIANTYTLDGRIILGGDAVHTHSPKAGQGMNISMIDMFSLAWKINLIEKGIGKRQEIMETYEHERRGVAQELLAFDAEYLKLFSASSSQAGQDEAHKLLEADPQRFIKLFKQNTYFTSGCGAVYHSNVFNVLPDSDLFKYRPRCQSNSPLKVGERLLPGDAIRVIDGNPVRIEQEIKMNGAFRIYIFLGGFPVSNRLDHLDSVRCFWRRFRSSNNRACSIFDFQSPDPNPFFTFLLITSRARDEWEIADLPPLFAGPYASQVYLDELPNKLADSEPLKVCSLHHKYGFDEGETGGGIMIVRPDGYVGLVTDLNDLGWQTVEKYFEGFLIES